MSADRVFRRIIRRAAIVAPLLGTCACATVGTAHGPATVVGVPFPGAGFDRDLVNREGTSYYNPRWSFDPDSHPAVRPLARGDAAGRSAPPAGSRAEPRADGQLAGATLGALAGAQAGNRAAGIVAGSAVGALAGGRLADPCAPSPNAGSVWGALAGAWLGSLFGGGRGREFWIAVGAAGGAVRGTEAAAEERRCR